MPREWRQTTYKRKKRNLQFCSVANQKKKKHFLRRRGKVFSANQKAMVAKFLALAIKQKCVAAAVSPKLHKYGSWARKKLLMSFACIMLQAQAYTVYTIRMFMNFLVQFYCWILAAPQATSKKKVKVLKILTGICTKVPLLSVGCENNGTTGTDPFLMNIGPCIGVTAESFWSETK